MIFSNQTLSSMALFQLKQQNNGTSYHFIGDGDANNRKGTDSLRG